MELNTTKPGGYQYWCVDSSLSANGKIYLWADRAEVNAAGSLVFWLEDKADHMVFAIAPGRWRAVYEASVEDGKPTAVENFQRTVKKQDPKEPVSAEEKILQLIESRGAVTVREVAQRVRILNSAQARTVIDAMVASGTLRAIKDGRTVRYA